ncbi:MAG: hypothetical protein GY925_12895 [Actinomycetia bacterium]|nr:hypothetical protein [Actinomycetes bacterium]
MNDPSFTPDEAFSLQIDMMTSVITKDTDLWNRALDRMATLDPDGRDITYAITYGFIAVICELLEIRTTNPDDWYLEIGEPSAPDTNPDATLAMTNACRMVVAYANGQHQTTGALLNAAMASDSTGVAGGRLMAAIINLFELGYEHRQSEMTP